MGYRRRAWRIAAALSVGSLGVVGVSSYATAQEFPPFTDSCPVGQIEKPCVDQTGASGTCRAAACEDTLDGGPPVSCVECAVCIANGGPFQRCTDTVPCPPGFSCFDYGGPQNYTSFGPPGDPLMYRVYTYGALCFEGGVGPATAQWWSPCDGAAPSASEDSGSGSVATGTSPGSTSSGTASSSGSTGSAPLLAGASEGGAGEIVETPAGPAPEAGTPVNGASTPDVVILRRGGCDVGTGAAAGGWPLLVMLALWMCRRARRFV
jgi:hypothetical protein